MNLALPLASGVLFAIGAIALLRITGMDRDRASAPITLVAIALFYPVFAIENGDLADVAFHVAIVIGFVGVAILSYKKGLVIVGVGMIAHGLFDIGMELLADNPAPDWWAAFCLGVDVVLGIWLIVARPWTRTTT